MRHSERNILAQRIIYYILGVLEVLLVFRFIFKLLGANPQSSFISLIYTLTGALLAPFFGIFKPFVTKGIESQSVMEPATLIGLLVYALIAWGLVQLLELRRKKDI
jgi:hypothetical protein